MPLVANFNGIGNFLSNGVLFLVVPPLIGAFVGAPVLAREFEAGTFRYAWTQGFGRWRWTLAKLVGLGVVVAAASGALSVLASWYYQPYFASGNQSLSLTTFNPLNPGLFEQRGLAFAAWTLAAFAIGALAGVLIRRVVPAIVTTLAVCGALAFATGGWLRMHYLTPLVTKGLNVPGSARIVSQWGSRGGRVVFTGPPSYPIYQQYCPAQAGLGKGDGSGSGNPLQCLTQHGFTFWTSYQPASRFWAFQWIEGGWLARAVGPAHRRDRLAGPSPRSLKFGVRRTPAPVCANVTVSTGRPYRRLCVCPVEGCWLTCWVVLPR